ncbi:hypothetical protein [Pseudomonas asplenii]|uniref:hypothetical protein n=1 Tax=Pseudomonas asplenii TaxID=53407 RepID=UPI002234730B|nr:hypothetical protein [Pseudomonas asplenii]UZE27265.1 hypothetical protein LOY63_18015 [Pseudomonas asplenii]
MTHKLSVSRWLIAGAISLCAGTSAFAAGLHSGKYEQLMLAVTPEHQVEGFYSEERGEGNFSCAFYLQGKPEALSTWVDEVYPGSVKASADGVTLKVEQGQQHPGCMNVLMPEIATGLDLSQTASKNWIGLVTVSADKALLQKTQNAKATKGPYIVKDDVVGVLAFKDGAAQVEYINAEGRSFTGWISQDQYTRLSVPKH